MTYSVSELINYLLLHNLDLDVAVLHYLCDNLDNLNEDYPQYSYQNDENARRGISEKIAFLEWFQDGGYVELQAAIEDLKQCIEFLLKLRIQSAMFGTKNVFDLQIYKHIKQSSGDATEDPITETLNQLLRITQNEN